MGGCFLVWGVLGAAEMHGWQILPLVHAGPGEGLWPPRPMPALGTRSRLPTVTVICAAPGADGAWWRAQVVAAYEDTNEVEIRYVDYGGYKRVKVDVLRQIR